MDLPSALRRLRLARDWSQLDLARKSGLDPSYICMLEKGVREPSLKVLRTLASTFKISVAGFIAISEDPLLPVPAGCVICGKSVSGKRAVRNKPIHRECEQQQIKAVG